MVVASSSPLDVADLRLRVGRALDTFVDKQRLILAGVSHDLDPVLAAIEAMLSGGKRLRPAFAYWGWRAAGQPDSDDIVNAVTSLELLQASALIHDDIMDGSDTRRGQPSLHRRFARVHIEEGWRGGADNFGLGAAVLLGDLAFAWADELLFSSGLSDDALLRAKPTYDQMRTELIAGQYLDLLEQARGGGSVEQALRVARFKSAKYTVEGPLHLGAQLAGAHPDLLATLSMFGLPLGEAFQLRDDLLGVFGNPQQTGKPAGDDLREGKRTALVALTLESASTAQREVFEARFGDAELDSDGVRVLQQVIVDSGARDVVEQLIEQRTEQACKSLEGIEANAAEVLADLALAATARKG